MAFQKDKTTAAQTAANVAGNVTQGLILAGTITDVDEAAASVVTVFSALFAELAPVVDGDNANFLAQEGTAPKASAPAKGNAGRSGKTGGGYSKGGSKGGSRSLTLEDALTLELNFGAFQGETLGAVMGFDAKQCDADFDYGDGERDGSNYMAWLASDKNKNDFVRARAQLIADDAGLDY